MKSINKHEPKKDYVGSIQIGDVFSINNNLFMRVSSVESTYDKKTYNAACFSGHLFSFPYDTVCKKVDGEFIY